MTLVTCGLQNCLTLPGKADLGYVAGHTVTATRCHGWYLSALCDFDQWNLLALCLHLHLALCRTQLQAFQLAELANVIWALAKWGYRPGMLWTTLFFKRCL